MPPRVRSRRANKVLLPDSCLHEPEWSPSDEASVLKASDHTPLRYRSFTWLSGGPGGRGNGNPVGIVLFCR